MPLYEYQCDACGHRFEVIQKIADPPIERCPKCGAAVRKLLSAPAFQFKGTGWYVTDYARKSGDASATGEGDSKKPEGKTDTKTESKGEARAETKSDEKAPPAASAKPSASKASASNTPSSGSSPSKS